MHDSESAIRSPSWEDVELRGSRGHALPPGREAARAVTLRHIVLPGCVIPNILDRATRLPRGETLAGRWYLSPTWEGVHASGERAHDGAPRSLAEALQAARRRAQLSDATLARMAGIEPRRLQEIEAGSAGSPAEIDACAQALGVPMEQLHTGAAERSPWTSLLAQWWAAGGPAQVDELARNGAGRVLGELVRCAQEINALEAMLGAAPPPQLPVPPAALATSEGAPLYGADRLAAWLRAELGLGLDEPITSMRELVEDRLGIRVLWVTPEQLDPVVESASTVAARSTMLVNLVEGGGCYRRIRMALAHELCHLLCDLGAARHGELLLSPRADQDGWPWWTLSLGFHLVERRARAFAACLLAPEAGVRRAIDGLAPTAPEAVTAVCETLWVGWSTAVARLEQTFHLGAVWRSTMVERGMRRWQPGRRGAHPDEVHDRIGLRSGILESLALQACAAGRVSKTRVRQHLGLLLTDPLPEHAGLTEAHRAPLRQPDDEARCAAQGWLDHGEEMAPDDPHLRWIEEHLDELRRYPSTWVAIDPVRGIVVHAKDGDEFADKLAALPREERKRLLTFNTSMCA